METSKQNRDQVKVTYTFVGTLDYRGRLLKQIASLQAAGYDCRLVLGDYLERPLKHEDYSFPIEAIPTPNRKNRLVLFLRQMIFGFKAGRRIADSDATHVVCIALESLLAGALAKRWRPDIKLIFDSKEMHVEAVMNPGKKILFRWLQKFCLRYCDTVMHAEGNRLEHFKEHHDPSGKNAHFLLENFPFHIPRENLEQRPPSPPTRVLYVGVLGFDRYTLELINIFRELAPEYSLDLVGPTMPASFKDEMESELSQNPAPNVRMLPPIPHNEMAGLIRNYHVGIALYKNTNLCNYYCAPNKVYDYLMSGIPVIANDYPGIMKVLEEGEVGACVREVDLENFRAALEKICREQRWNNVTEEVRARYSWEAQNPGFLALFD